MSYQNYEQRVASPNNPSYGTTQNEDTETNSDYPFGVPVYLTSFATQMAFVRKIYCILSAQLLVFIIITTPLVYVESGREFIQRYWWLWWVALILTIGLLVALTYKANDEYQPPRALVVLFTLLNGFVIGSVVGLLKLVIVLDAMMLLLLVSFGMVIYTFQKKYNFKSKQTIIYNFVILNIGAIPIHPWVFSIIDAVPALIIASIISTFFILDLYYMIQIMNKNEYWGAAMQLHLDLVVPFRSIHHICEVSENE
ncbi:hypothetical protein G9A89_022705 [Geosiphon pyriformis]|nr:hypothetical protein G9A89_022705 [Geosiphon pyriformis]